MTTKKNIKKSSKKVNNKESFMGLFQESQAQWEQLGDFLMLDDEEIAMVTECVAKCYDSDNGTFTKVYMTLENEGKVMHLMGDPDSTGKVRRGIKVDAKSEKVLDLSAGEEEELNPEDVAVYKLKNTDTGEVITRCRILW